MDRLPDLTVHDAEGTELKLSDLPLPLVLYFYPKDDTPGCTREAQDFSALLPDFAAVGVQVLGISRDSVAKHARFAAKHALAVPLASDTDGSVTEAFGVYGEKKLYGRVHMGIERATFLYGRDGALVQAWRKVRVPGHAEAVLAAARALPPAA